MERHAFDNLLILCPIHHDVVDSDVESYTVERLARMKAEHEQKFQQDREPTDEIAAQFIANITANTITHGSIVFTQNQLGGQAAHTIINVGPPPRRISDAAGVALVSELQKYPKGTVYVASVMGDAEAALLAEDIAKVLTLAGWKVSTGQLGFTGAIRGVIFEAAEEQESYLAILNWLENLHLKPQGRLVASKVRPEIIVGSNMM
jgi:hypothetical protein